jgi:transposase-like protein
MNLINFMEKFPDETSCRQQFKLFRDREGVICKKCKCTEHYWLSTIEQYKCKKCGFRTTLRSGTVMENSKLPFRYWLIAIHLLSSIKKPFSALELQRQIGHKFYEPVWAMVQKLRLAMGDRDSQYKLDEFVELDEGFFESIKEEEVDELTGKKAAKKRGRGSQKQSKVLVMTSTKEAKPTKKNQKPSKLRYVKMIVVEDLKATTIEQQVERNIEAKSTVKTDGFRGYSNIDRKVKEHHQQVIPAKKADKLLPWVHTVIANAKRQLLGIHHSVSDKYMQNYLNEFCYKLNRRYFGEKLFDRLMVAAVKFNF